MEIPEILSLNDYQAYNLLIASEDDFKIPKDRIRVVRFGFDIHFDYYNYLHDRYYVKSKSGQVFIEDNWYALSDFYTELEKRKKTTINLLLRYVADKDIYEDR